jgi:hypothetical protein
MTIDLSKLTPLGELKGEDAEETRELQDLAQRALDFVRSFEWCDGVREIRSGIAIAGVVGVFFVSIVPRSAAVDGELWIIVGDVPPAYIVTDDAPTPADALIIYAELMRQWIDAVRQGRGIADLIPVDAEPTKAAADSLDSRLRFLVERVVPQSR